MSTQFHPDDYPLALTTPRRLTTMRFWHMHIPFTFAVTQMVRPKLLVELGTHMGDSYCAFCQAVEALGLDTRCCAIDCWEGDKHTGAYDQSILDELRAHHDPLYGRFSTLIQRSFDDALPLFEDGTIDLLHIDGLHTYEGVKHDFESWLPKMSRSGVILMHDTHEHRNDFGVFQLWDELKRRYPTFEFPYGHGLGVMAVGERIPTGMGEFFNDTEHALETAFYYMKLGERILAMDAQRDAECAGEADAAATNNVPSVIASVRGVAPEELPQQAPSADEESSSIPRLIAFYLPQFHPIPENDAWWGEGFTEWRNVVQAQPLFPGHYQPHLPADLGFYDLRLPEVRQAQADLAREHGIYGFCYYHYWFNGRRLLERPFDEVLAAGEPDFPFCLCWVNESWSRNWDGREGEALVVQSYSQEDDRNHIRWLIRAFKDPRYIRINGRPLILVYRVKSLPSPERTFTTWREECRLAGLPEPYIVGVETHRELEETRVGCDAAAEFLPHGFGELITRVEATEEWVKSNTIYDYEALVKAHLERPVRPYPWFPCVATNWDNTARRQKGNALLLRGSTPELYEQWLAGTIAKQAPNSADENIIFINAWNEWAEGTHLEPDLRYGRAYLEATKRAVVWTGHVQARTAATRDHVASHAIRYDAASDARYRELLEKYMRLQSRVSEELSAAARAPMSLVHDLEQRLEEQQAAIKQFQQWQWDYEETCQWLLKEKAQHEQQIVAQEEQIAARDETYRQEIELLMSQAAVREAVLRAERDQQEANVTALYRTKAVRLIAAYWKLRSESDSLFHLGVRFASTGARAAYRAVVPYKLRREWWYRRNTGRGYKYSQEAREEQRKTTPEWKGPQPTAVTALATVTALAVAPAACNGKPAGVARGPDIICFPVIDWDFRFQRPQQVLSQFARTGHRGYYLNIKFTGMHETAVRTRRIGERLYELFLPGDADLIIYRDRLTRPTLRKALVALQLFAQQESIAAAVLIVQHPFWAPLAEALRETYGWKIIYDCMDDHSGFSDNSPEVPAQEEHLVRTSDLVITTSRLLQDKMSQRHANAVLVPNAGDYAHFSKAASRSRSPIAHLPRPAIGYYGAIAEWFDVAAMAEATACHPEWSFVLIGHTFGADLAALEKLPNVHLLGEKPYAELPGYVAGFDVCTIPFRRIPLTEATNPVKLFEYLATGKPVVARRLPEIEPYADTVALYDTPAEFVAKLEEAVASDTPQPMRARQAVARENTWAARYDVFSGAIKQLYGRASVIIVSYNNLELMQRTLASILEKTEYPNYEVIVVDNGSGPEVTDYLEEMAAEYPDQIKVVLNGRNVGFAAATNVGIKMATQTSQSDYLVLLNNDVIVTRGWLTTLIRHLDDEQIGIVGPVTNSCGNEARIDVDYADISGIDAFATHYTSAHEGQIFDIPVLAMYCAALRRAVVDETGLLDEIFGVGMFEDDDYALRIREAGYRVVCAEDVFIHHFGRASFSKMQDEAYKRLFEENKRLFEQKWNRTWVPHRYRPHKEMGLLSRALAGARSSR